MPLKKGSVKPSSKKPLKKGGVKYPTKLPLKKEGVKSSSKKPLKKGGAKDDPIKPRSQSMQNLLDRLEKPTYRQDPQDLDYVKPSPLKDKRGALSVILRQVNQPLENQPLENQQSAQSALSVIQQSTKTGVALKRLIKLLQNQKY